MNIDNNDSNTNTIKIDQIKLLLNKTYNLICLFCKQQCKILETDNTRYTGRIIPCFSNYVHTNCALWSN